jgi:hypothetical protein
VSRVGGPVSTLRWRTIGRRLGGSHVQSVLAAALILAAPASSAPPSEAPFLPVATIQDLMLNQVDPSADLLWASVSTVITAAGTDEKQPRTAAEWLTVRQYAVTLIEAGNLLLIPRRQVAERGKKTDDSDIPGIESPEHMQRAIDTNPAAFRKAALALRTAGVKVLTAIDARNPEALTEAGGDLDAACEACHLRYWYPHSPRPP